MNQAVQESNISPSRPTLHSGTPAMLNHVAWVTHDVGATADFYIRVLGMELASTILDENVPSTGDSFPYFHIFFRMKDGSTIAFFECPGLPERAQASHPAYEVFEHIALQVDDSADLLRWKAWLEDNGVDVLGPVDHKGIIESIYFHDPNGIRLELTTPIDPLWNRHTSRGLEDLERWCDTKKQAQDDGKDMTQALKGLIRDIRRSRYA